MFREGQSNSEIDNESVLKVEPISETKEENPGRAMDKVLSTIEQKEEADPITCSSWIKEHKKGLLIAGGAVGVGAACFLPKKFLLLPFVKFAAVPLFLFAKRMVEKGGNLSFHDGMEIAEKTIGIFNIGDKK